MILWLNPIAGLSGDMLLASLVDLGAPLAAVRDSISSTGLAGWRLDVDRDRTNGIPACRVTVTVEDTAAQRRASDLLALVHAARPAPVAELAGRALRAIVDVEARLHDRNPDELHLHELGGHDTIIDLVGVAAAVHLLDVDQVISAPLRLGTGVVDSRHGRLPAPAPATLALMEGMTVASCPVDGETVTPTGAALLRAMRCEFGQVPAARLRATGYGMGTRRFDDRPNILVAMLCEPTAGNDDGKPTAPMVIETTVDDVTGEQLAYIVNTLLECGASDVWVCPIISKKGRPAHIVGVLSQADLADVLEDRLLRETGSLGARRTRVEKTALSRHSETIELDGHPVRIKHGPYGRKPEYEDIARIARESGMPLRRVAERALERADAKAADHNIG